MQKKRIYTSKNKLQRNKSVEDFQYNSTQSKFATTDYVRSPILDPRDVKIIIDIDKVIQNILSAEDQNTIEHIIRKWLVNMYGVITSDAFNKYNRQQLKQSQTKVFTCKNFLYNINNLMLKLKDCIEQSDLIKLYQFINQQSKNIINQIILKYPQSFGRVRLKNIKNQISRTDNRQNDKFDFFNIDNNRVDLKFCQNKTYYKQIMQSINKIIKIANRPLHSANQQYHNQNNFDGFVTLLQNIFIYSGCKQFQNEFQIVSKVYQQIKDQGQVGKQKPILFQLLFTPNNQQTKNIMNEHKQKINKSCFYQINQKIAADVQCFTSDQIQSMLFRIPDVSILRVMTKWAEQLRNKIKNAKEQILKRSQPLKTNNGDFIDLNGDQKYLLYKEAKKEEKKISEVYNIIQQYYIEMSGKISLDDFNYLYNNDEDGNLALYSVRSQTCIGECLLIYLNQLINSLLRIVHNAALEQQNEIQRKKIQSINLITFKVGDLLRARCKSTQKHVIQIYKFLQKLSDKHPHILEIVRVKDRLDQKDKDILINLFFLKRVQCQIQFSVISQIDSKQNKFNKFNHFVYQLKRSQFGPLAQSACILAQYDPAISNYVRKQQLLPKYITPVKQKKNKIKDKEEIQNKQRQYEAKKKQLQLFLPFFCSICKNFDKNINPFFYKQKNYKQCSKCYQNNSQNIKSNKIIKQILSGRQMYKMSQIDTIQDHFEIVNNKKGLQILKKGLLISKTTPTPRLLFFQAVKQSQNDSVLYLLGKNNQNFSFSQSKSNNSEKENKIKILLQIDFQIRKAKKVLDNVFILRLKEKYLDMYSIYDNKLDKRQIQCQLCQKNVTIQYPLILKTLKEIKLQEQISNVVKKQKQTFQISNKKLTNEVNLLFSLDWSYKNEDNFYLIEQQFGFKNPIKNKYFGKLNKILSIKASKNYFQNILFIKYFPNLLKIDLSHNFVQSLKPIQGLMNLQEIKCQNNHIKDATPLCSLKKLKIINLSWNHIGNLPNLYQLQQIQILNLKYNRINRVKNINFFQSIIKTIGIQICFEKQLIVKWHKNNQYIQDYTMKKKIDCKKMNLKQGDDKKIQQFLQRKKYNNAIENLQIMRRQYLRQIITSISKQYQQLTLYQASKTQYNQLSQIFNINQKLQKEEKIKKETTSIVKTLYSIKIQILRVNLNYQSQQQFQILMKIKDYFHQLLSLLENINENVLKAQIVIKKLNISRILQLMRIIMFIPYKFTNIKVLQLSKKNDIQEGNKFEIFEEDQSDVMELFNIDNLSINYSKKLVGILNKAQTKKKKLEEIDLKDQNKYKSNATDQRVKRQKRKLQLFSTQQLQLNQLSQILKSWECSYSIDKSNIQQPSPYRRNYMIQQRQDQKNI